MAKGELRVGGLKTTSKCCSWTTDEERLMNRNESDEFTERARQAQARQPNGTVFS